MNIKVCPFWSEMTSEEKLDHFNKVGNNLLENRYRYYIKDDPALGDFEYDYLEKYYEFLAKELNLPNIASNMVDYDLKRQDCINAKFRVDNDLDNYSLWVISMKPIWSRLGIPKYRKKLTTTS